MIMVIKVHVLWMEFIHKCPILLTRAVRSNRGFIVCIEWPIITNVQQRQWQAIQEVENGWARLWGL